MNRLIEFTLLEDVRWYRSEGKNRLTDLCRHGLIYLKNFPSRCLIGGIRVYQMCSSPFLGPCCRFYPSCSVYWIESIQRYGMARGILKGIFRICRCHPFHPGGYDPP